MQINLNLKRVKRWKMRKRKSNIEKPVSDTTHLKIAWICPKVANRCLQRRAPTEGEEQTRQAREKGMTAGEQHKDDLSRTCLNTNPNWDLKSDTQATQQTTQNSAGTRTGSKSRAKQNTPAVLRSRWWIGTTVTTWRGMWHRAEATKMRIGEDEHVGGRHSTSRKRAEDDLLEAWSKNSLETRREVP